MTEIPQIWGALANLHNEAYLVCIIEGSLMTLCELAKSKSRVFQKVA